MRESGADGISVAMLMKRAGLTHGGFYAHFDNRDDLVAHAVDRMSHSSRATLARNLDDAEPAAGLAALIDDYLSEIRLDNIARGCPLSALLCEVNRMPPAARERFKQNVEFFRLRIEDTLRALGQADAEALSRSIFAEMVGAAILARASSDRESAVAGLAATRERLKERLGLTRRAAAN